MRRRHPYKLYGAGLLAVVCGLVALSVLSFNQAFTPARYVTVHMHRAGLQLLPGSDVKVHGIVVGSVESIRSTGEGADIRLRLRPDKADSLPANVTVRLLPKTLFGEKYVDLVPPAQPAARHLGDVAAIAQDHTRTTLEIDEALDDLLPMLRAVPPVELNHTLTAVAGALSGRGERVGRTVEELDGYLRELNPHLGRMGHDLNALGDVAGTYARAAPALLRMLGNLTVTSGTVVDERRQLSAFLDDVTGAADATRDLLARNATNLVAVNRVNRPVLSLLARYSPEFPCFFKGYAKLIPRIHHAVGQEPGIKHSARVVVEFVPAFPTYQRPIDLPEFGDTRGPSCYGLPDPPMSLPVIRYRDGTEDDPRFDGQGGSGGRSDQSGDPRRSTPTARSSPAGAQPRPLGRAFSPAMGVAGTAEEQRMFGALLGPLLGLDALAVPDIADLLWGPMARGSAVRLS